MWRTKTAIQTEKWLNYWHFPGLVDFCPATENTERLTLDLHK